MSIKYGDTGNDAKVTLCLSSYPIYPQSQKIILSCVMSMYFWYNEWFGHYKNGVIKDF